MAVKDDKVTYTTTLVGNPFMSHLDFRKFASANGITNGYYVCTAVNTYDAINPDIFIEDPNEIAPMQSFIVEKTGKISHLNFTFDMAIAAPSPSSTGATLKSATTFAENSILQLQILRDNVVQSNIRLKYDPSESNDYDARKDMWTLFSQDITGPAVIYTLLDGKAASIRTLGDLSEPIELCIRTSTKGLLTLRLSGMETLDTKYGLYLEDKLTGTIHDLRDNPEYTFDNQTGDIVGRLFLRTNNDLGGSITTPSESNIRIFADNRIIRITSSSDDPIDTIKIYSLLGSTLANKQSVNQSSFSMDSPVNSQVIIVSVTTRTQQKTEKLIIR